MSQTPTPVAASAPHAKSPLHQLRATFRAFSRALIPARVILQRGPARGPRVALTFDDGPDDHTLRYLDLLDRLQVRATFYLVGEAMERRPELVAEYLRRGHQLGFHGHTHRHFTRLPAAELWDELQRAPALLGVGSGAVGGVNLLRGRPMVRPPYGAIDLPRVALCHAAGLLPVLWSLDTMDWKIQEAQELVAYMAKQQVRGGEILLLHEGQDWTLAALPPLIQDLRDRGFELVTISELFDAEGLRPAAGAPEARSPGAAAPQGA